MTLKILIAEDNYELVNAYRMVLEGRGHEVMITTNGIECYRAYKQYTKQFDGKIKQHFDLVILDQNMLGMDGIETAKEIQKINPKQKMVFITGNGLDVLKKLGQLPENARIVNKPFTVQALITEVEGFSAIKFRTMAKAMIVDDES
ncbi:MAG: response regulator [Nitrosotalea sp.]